MDMTTVPDMGGFTMGCPCEGPGHSAFCHNASLDDVEDAIIEVDGMIARLHEQAPWLKNLRMPA